MEHSCLSNISKITSNVQERIKYVLRSLVGRGEDSVLHKRREGHQRWAKSLGRDPVRDCKGGKSWLGQGQQTRVLGPNPACLLL